MCFGHTIDYLETEVSSQGLTFALRDNDHNNDDSGVLLIFASSALA